MNLPVLIVGGGIGGLAAALACARVGLPVQVVEQADAFAEVGAGIQLGPNAMRVLADLGVTPVLDADLAWPLGLHVRDLMDGRQLAHLHLGEAMVTQYGAPYATVARADLHRALLASLGQHSKDRPAEAIGSQTGTRLLSWEQQDAAVLAHVQRHAQSKTSGAAGTSIEARVLVGADGARSQVRSQLKGLPSLDYSGHVAYRAVIDQQRLPVHLRQRDVSVWLGPGLHVVHYPIAGGQRLNIVALLEGPLPQGPVGWDHPAPMPALLAQLRHAHRELKGLTEAVPEWRMWPLFRQTPLAAAEQMAQGRVALLGDAAHATLPYLAQGAAMAIEDAQALAACLAQAPEGQEEQALQRYAQLRWKRCARVQGVSSRNGWAFHVNGPLAVARNLLLRVRGENMLNQAWLYGHEGPALQHL